MNEIAKVKKEVKLAQWAEMVRSRSESGLTVTDWCKQNGIQNAPFFLRKSNKKTIARGYRFRIEIFSFVCSGITAKIRPIVSDLQNFPKMRGFAKNKCTLTLYQN